MAQIIKRPFKTFNGTDWDTHHFETEASQVKTAGGSDVETQLAEKANKIQGAWVSPTFVNGWSNWANGYQIATFLKDDFGFIHLKGLVKVGTKTENTIIFTFPIGYRPGGTMWLSVPTNGSTAYLKIETDGTLKIVAIPSEATYISLESIIFREA